MLKKNLRNPPDDQVKVPFAPVTQLLKGHSTVVEMKDPMVHTETRGSPPGFRNLPKSSPKRDLSKFDYFEKADYQQQRNVGAAVNKVTTNELARFESNKRLKTNMHTFEANHNTLMLISFRLSYLLLPCVYVFFRSDTVKQNGQRQVFKTHYSS